LTGKTLISLAGFSVIYLRFRLWLRFWATLYSLSSEKR